MSHTWLGGIYIKDEGGYEIIIRALSHYKKRLRTISASPELRDSGAMFATILEQEAMKTFPKIDALIKKIQDSLHNINLINKLHDDIALLEKSLLSYETDIQKAIDGKHEYYIKLVGNVEKASKDLPLVKIAQGRLNEFV